MSQVSLFILTDWQSLTLLPFRPDLTLSCLSLAQIHSSNTLRTLFRSMLAQFHRSLWHGFGFDDAFPYTRKLFSLPKRDPPPPADAHINGEDWGDFLMCAGVHVGPCVCAWLWHTLPLLVQCPSWVSWLSLSEEMWAKKKSRKIYMVVTYMQVHTKIYGSNEFACGCNWAFIGYNLTLK